MALLTFDEMNNDQRVEGFARGVSFAVRTIFDPKDGELIAMVLVSLATPGIVRQRTDLLECLALLHDPGFNDEVFAGFEKAVNDAIDRRRERN